MAVIPASQMALMRKRRQLRTLLQQRQWREVAKLESELFKEITTATEDPDRSPKELLAELSSVIGLYRELTELCQQYGQQYRHLT